MATLLPTHPLSSSSSAASSTRKSPSLPTTSNTSNSNSTPSPTSTTSTSSTPLTCSNSSASNSQNSSTNSGLQQQNQNTNCLSGQPMIGIIGPFNSVIGSNSELSSSLRGAYQFQNGKNGNRNGMKENGVVNSSSGEIVNGTTKVLSSLEENEKQKIYFQEQTKRYYSQLTQGCGDSNCLSRFCASSKFGPKVSNATASLMSLELASKPKLYYCEKLKEKDFLPPPIQQGQSKALLTSLLSYPSFAFLYENTKLNKISQNSKEKSEKGMTPILDSKKPNSFLLKDVWTKNLNHTSIHQLETKHFKSIFEKSIEQNDNHQLFFGALKNSFSDYKVLGNSFKLKDAPFDFDFEAISEFFQFIFNLEPKNIISCIIATSLEDLLSNSQVNSDPTFYRSLLLIIEAPLLTNPIYDQSLLKWICLKLSTLSQTNFEYFVNNFSKFEKSKFERFLKILQKYLITRFYPVSRPDNVVISIVKTIDLLYKANEKANEEIIHFSGFYLEELSQKLNFKSEYKHWLKPFPTNRLIREQVNSFCFFDYPYFFDTSAKVRIMHINAMIQMGHEFEDALIHNAWMHQTQRALSDYMNVEDFDKSFKTRASPFLVLEIRRQELILDAYNQLQKKIINLKKPLKVRFISSGEEGMDHGGVQKEFFQEIINIILHPNYGMFTYDPATHLSWFNPQTLDREELFEFIGTIFGLSVYNGVILAIHFPLAFYKKILNQPLNLQDLESLHLDTAQGLHQLLTYEGDVETTFGISFEIVIDVFGEKKVIELCENGSQIPVTNENRQAYVDAYVKYLLEDSIQKVFEPFQRGFLSVCGGPPLRMCRPQELELLVCGYEDPDLRQLEEVALYDDGYSSTHETIKNFWEIVHELPKDLKLKLLNFVTASERIPSKGFSCLTFVIQRNGPDSDRLPTALTCFGRLLLPEYSSKEKLKERLLLAIQNAKGFGLV